MAESFDRRSRELAIRGSYLTMIGTVLYAYVYMVLGHHMDFDVTNPTHETYNTYGILAATLAAVGMMNWGTRKAK